MAANMRCSKGWWWRWALTGTKRMNKRLDLPCNDTPVYHPAGLLPVKITSSESSVQLYWRLHKRGGSARQQCGHYRYCTAHTVRKQSSLWCAICSYDAAAWKREKLAVMPAVHCELPGSCRTRQTVLQTGGTRLVVVACRLLEL